MSKSSETMFQPTPDLSDLTLLLRCYDVWSATDTGPCDYDLGTAITADLASQ